MFGQLFKFWEVDWAENFLTNLCTNVSIMSMCTHTYMTSEYIKFW